MLSVSEAQRAISKAIAALPAETVSLASAAGRVLAQAVTAERDQPPFDRVTMDGIALRHAALASGRDTFAIAGTQFAGDAALTLNADDQCIEIMTGAMLPPGSDCIVPVERTKHDDGKVVIEPGYHAEPGQFVHRQGSDHAGGHRLLERGHKISALDVALLASAGLATVSVARQPVLQVLSTGNELVAAGEPIAQHQVRLSNGPALVAMLAAQGYSESAHAHIADDPGAMREVIRKMLADSDVLVLSGGVSMGKADFVPRVLDELGVKRVFHKIAQRPGKPMWFGVAPGGTAVFALPGNPVSALTCCRHYLLPALLRASGGTPRPPLPAVLSSGFHFRPDLTCFLPVRQLADDDGRLLVEPVVTNTSGDFTALSGTDGYVELDRAQSEFEAGSVQPLHYWSQV